MRLVILLLLISLTVQAEFPVSADSINRMAVNEWSAGNYQKAFNHITKAYELAKEKNDSQQLAMILNTLGLVYWRLGNNTDAMESYRQSAALAEKRGMNRLLGLTHTNMALIYKEQGEFAEAFNHNNLAIGIFRKNNNHRDLGIALNNQGQIFKNMGVLDSAKRCYDQALVSYRQIDYKDGVAATYYNLADIFLKRGTKEQALQAINYSLRLSLLTESKVRTSEAYQKLSQIYEFFRMPDSALKYFKLYNELNNKILKQDQLDQLAKFQAELGSEVKNLQIENLKKEKELQINRIWFIGISVLLLLLLTIFVVYRYFLKIKFRKENLEKELHNAAKIIEVKEQELKAYIIDLTRKNNVIGKMKEQLSLSLTRVSEIKTDQDVQTDERVEQLLEQKILTDEDWSVFKGKFKAIYPGFFTRIKQFNAGLTEAEERLLVLIYLDLSGREMANTLGISPQSVRVCKMRMKKKLQDKGFNNVEDFLLLLVK
ncbi:MAG TPA: tetratricopeptide repeat protein [Lentimicrobium sp.]|nr:tetratricopeptide repeat protein [Lentimicrobium sp.]